MGRLVERHGGSEPTKGVVGAALRGLGAHRTFQIVLGGQARCHPQILAGAMQASRIRGESPALRVPASILCAAVALLAACGHPATKEECEEIFTRSAELALKEKDVRERDEVKKQIEQARTVKGDKLIEECLGKRITEEAMECVRGSESPQELDACLD